MEANEATTAMSSAGPTLPLSPSAPSHSSSLSTSYAEKPTSSSSGGMKLSGQKPTLDSLLSLSNETNDDGWGDLDEEQPKSIPTIPKIHTNELSKSASPASAPIKQGPAAPSLQPMKPTQSTRLNVAGPSLSRAHSTNNATSTQENSKTVQKSPSLNALIPSPPTTPSMPLSKEEKAQELARKKEERVQKIAQIKAAKAAANSGSLI